MVVVNARIKDSLVVLLLVAYGVALAGCGDDEENPVTGPLVEALVGAWDEEGYDRRLILESDGDFRFESPSGVPMGRGTWSAAGAELTHL